jgi:hypothetical protein
MKNKALAIHLILEMTENRANACQVPWHSPSLQARYAALFGLVVLLVVIAG